MSFSTDIENRQRANVGGVVVTTADEVSCCQQLRAALQKRATVTFWSTASGKMDDKMRPVKGAGEHNKVVESLQALLRSLREGGHPHPTATIVLGAEAVLESTAVARRLVLEASRVGRLRNHLLVVVKRGREVHSDLRELMSLNHPLPDRAATKKLIEGQLSSWKRAGTPALFSNVDDATTMLIGLTASQQADALGLCLAEAPRDDGPRQLSVTSLRQFKEAEVGKLGFLQVVTPEKTFSDILGHETLKAWVNMRKAAFADSEAATPRGMMLVGPPGTGKSRIVEAVAHALGFPMLDFSLGSMYSKWLGETEAQLRQALDIAERMSPCVLFVDEVDLVMTDDADGGTSQRVLGEIQKWMSLKKDPVFVVFTANFPQRLPAALTRKGRLDEIWQMGFPDDEEREAIFRYYLKGTDVEPSESIVQDTAQWAPSEIEHIIKEAKLNALFERRPLSLEDVEQEASVLTPVSKSMREDIEVMESWSKEYARPTKNNWT